MCVSAGSRPPTPTFPPSHSHNHALKGAQQVGDGGRVRLVPPVRAGGPARQRGDRRVRAADRRDGGQEQLGRVGGQGGGQVDLAWWRG